MGQIVGKSIDLERLKARVKVIKTRNVNTPIIGIVNATVKIRLNVVCCRDPLWNQCLGYVLYNGKKYRWISKKQLKCFKGNTANKTITNCL